MKGELSWKRKVHFKLHKVKKHWVTIAVTGLALGLSFAGLNYASAEEQPTPVNEATVEASSKKALLTSMLQQVMKPQLNLQKTQLLPLRAKPPQYQKHQ